MRLQILFLLSGVSAMAATPFRIEVVDKENGWPVPLVELKTTHGLSWITDNAGLAAIAEPDCMDREMYFHISSDGYEVEADGFGFRGVRSVPKEGGSLRIEVARTMVAKRLGRLTGAGIFAEAQKLGDAVPLSEGGIMGCDSVLLTPHRGKMFWLWGDSSVARYPLGIFDTSAAFTPLKPLEKFEPPLALHYKYFRDGKGFPRGVADLPGDGPTWLSGLASLPFEGHEDVLVATYSKIEKHLNEYETGLCEWDESGENFVVKKVLWKKGQAKDALIPRGHPVRWKDEKGKPWLLFGDPFPTLRMPADYASWSNPETWEKLIPPTNPKGKNGEELKVHRGSIAWNTKRGKWLSIFTQQFGKPSMLGEIWLSESESPFGPWEPATKVLTHHNYTFYNPVLHPELTPEGASFILFEGTYTAEFSNGAVRTPRYNYNQILYRVDFADLD